MTTIAHDEHVPCAAGEPTTGAPQELAPVDVLVCGGGPAGIAAAMMAARQGANTLLVERYGRLGGMAVNALVGPLLGRVESAWVDSILDHIGGRNADREFLDLRYADLLEAAGADLLLHAPVVGALLDGNRVGGVQLLTKQGLANIRAAVTIDATGDGDVAFSAGAEYEQGRGAAFSWEADGLCQPMSIMFRVSGIDDSESMEAHGGRPNYRFPDGRTWSEVTLEAHGKGELPETVGIVRTCPSHRPDQRLINAAQVNRVDGTRMEDLTKAELEARRQATPILEFLRRHAPGYKDAYISSMPAVIGVRETRRIRGLDYLTLDDLLEGRRSDTAVVRGASFGIDIHNPDGIGQAIGLYAGSDPEVKPYDIPYGCLVPKDTEGLLVAGRCISGSHEAMASYRVQVIAMAIGVAAGTAATAAARQRVSPRDVDVNGVQEVVFTDSAGL